MASEDRWLKVALNGPIFFSPCNGDLSPGDSALITNQFHRRHNQAEKHGGFLWYLQWPAMGGVLLGGVLLPYATMHKASLLHKAIRNSVS